ncbi:MAG: VOC family protein, partial [Streptosporangiaceae bacterium]
MPLLHEVAHLGHAELLTPEPERSLWFFTEVLGLTENGSAGSSVYLRTWDDYEHHSLKLTAAATSGLGRTGLRASSEEALQRRVAAVEASGLGIGWRDGDSGIGPTYLFRDPDGHEIELYFETERFRPSAELRPALKNQAQAYPGRGVSVRRLDHVNFLAAQTEPNGRFICDAL